MWTVLTVGQCHPPSEIISSQNCNQSCRNTSATILTQRLLGGNFLSLWFLPTHPFFYSVVQNALSISSTLTFNHKFEGCWTEGVFHFGNNKRPSKPLSTENNSAHQKCSGRSIEQTLESLFWLQKSCTFLTTEIFITKRTESLSRLNVGSARFRCYSVLSFTVFWL